MSWLDKFSTYDEYCRLRTECGYEPAFAMTKEVWDKCDPDAQNNMLKQMRDGAAELAKYEASHGEVW